MRRPSEKRCINDESDQKGNEEEGNEEGHQEDTEDSTNHEDLSEDELMMEDEVMEDDRGQESQLQESKPKNPPRVPHKKIKLHVASSQKEARDLEKLEAELKKKNPDKKYIKKAMETTFLQRRKWIQEECPSVKEILSKYPLFRKSKYVSAHYEINLSIDARIPACL